MKDKSHELIDDVDYFCPIKQGWGSCSDTYCRFCGEAL